MIKSNKEDDNKKNNGTKDKIKNVKKEKDRVEKKTSKKAKIEDTNKLSIRKLIDDDAKKEKENVDKKKKEKEKNTKSKNIKIAFNILAIFCILIFAFSIVPKELQNDTFYTIKLGQYVRDNGIDLKEHFSWHEDIDTYMFPHWLYDVGISIVYDYMGGYLGLYISTILCTMILALAMYFANKRFSKNDLVSFAITMFQVYVMKSYIAVRAQLVTFVLFTFTVILIHSFLEKPKVWKGIILVIIPWLIANLHSAVFPFYFVLYLPFIAEYLIAIIRDLHLINKTNKRLKKASEVDVEKYKNKLKELNKKLENEKVNFEKFLLKQNEVIKNPYKLRIDRNDNMKWIILIMVISLFTGLLTPIKDMPYTYTWRIMKGTTTSSINEHLPLTLINEKQVLIPLIISIVLLAFSRIKIKLSDLFMFGGLTILALMSKRQVSMLAIFGGMVAAKMIADFIEIYDKNGTEILMDYLTSVLGEVILIAAVVAVSYTTYKPKINENFIRTGSYPIEATTWIKENLDVEKIKLFNDYNYGSYLMMNDIPVFIDSRCDLYTPEFNGKYNFKEHKFEGGKDVFKDYMDISTVGTSYDNKFEEYGITHIICKSNSKLKMLISKDSGYKQIYKDGTFYIFERLNSK